MSDYESLIGKTDIQGDVITHGLVERYRAVIGQDDNSAHIPYGLHWCTGLPKAPMHELGPDGHPKTGGFLPASKLPRRMWASSKVEFLQPIKIGAKIERSSTIASIKEKHGRSGALLFVDVQHVTKADGVESVREVQTIVYRGAPSEAANLPIAKEFSVDDWAVTKVIMPTPALLFRYSALTFNTHRIHYDHDYAVNVEGYPALVVHGPLMASLLLNFAAQLADGGSITQFEFRGLSPAFCGLALTLAGNVEANEIDLSILGVDGTKIMAAKAVTKE